ncbi:MAG: hypothetical protein J7L96_07415, partial [Bacteroidales bacterium]|nr:hypothetical protein [Bacteroidales bacterium]
MTNNPAHSFHIPVMGLGFTIDTPVKVAQLGIDSVISIVDDGLIEKIREFYCNKLEIPYHEITDKIEDFRAKRITSYLDMVNNIVEQKFHKLKNATFEAGSEIMEYINLLPDLSGMKQEFKEKASKLPNLNDIKSWVKDNLSKGSIDVNIMTKLDKENYIKGEKMPVEDNDAHAALRGYANSQLHSAIILSAGMNPRLYSYLEQFNDFFPDENGYIKKKIALKVSDYRSALIQGKFLAKKGLWVSEYRIESGLNCGGHAFATDGYLMGPILEEFRVHKEELIESIHEILINALSNKHRSVPEKELPLKITAQGGVGTAEEHAFLIDHYKVDSVGWGTPFLLVPEATNVDDYTINQLINAKEDDLYLSNISPLGVPFNNLRNNTKDLDKLSLAHQGKPGSPCPKKYLTFNKKYTDIPICTASRQYQKRKIKELDAEGLSTEEYNERLGEIIEKSCLCTGLGASALLINDLDTSREGDGVSICPGPNMAYFSKKMSLREITDHIYGRLNVITRTDRPNVFIRELQIYIAFLRNKIEESRAPLTNRQEKYFLSFVKNLRDGIDYYYNLFSNLGSVFEDTKSSIISALNASKSTLHHLLLDVENL